jgi:uncharacterized protein (TIGR00661 family)
MKILYGVPGEGMGHATRSKVVVDYLLKKHDVRIVSSSRAFRFLNESFPGRVSEIEGFHLAYKNARVDKFKTAYSILKNAKGSLRNNFLKYVELSKTFFPDLVISDFESFAFWFALQHRLPIISIDNMQIISRCNLEFRIPREEKENYWIAKNIIRAKVPSCRNYLITTFFYPKIRRQPAVLVPPILRDKILARQPSGGNHLVVYQTAESQEKIIGDLHALGQETFHVYGFNRSENHGNVLLKTFSEDGFIDDLASCKGVIANGGFSLISEAVYLKKPVCSIPIQNQFEQFVNAAYIEKLGYGRHFGKMASDSIKAFLCEIERFHDNLTSYSQNGNELLFQAIEREMEKL